VENAFMVRNKLPETLLQSALPHHVVDTTTALPCKLQNMQDPAQTCMPKHASFFQASRRITSISCARDQKAHQHYQQSRRRVPTTNQADMPTLQIVMLADHDPDK
jgi:hypothetical protein